MILNGLGAKAKMAKEIIPLIPKHDIYIERFFRTGGIFFKKNKVKQNYLNDLDAEIFNFWNIIKHRKDDFLKEWNELPIDQNLFNHWKKNKETDHVLQAIRFCFLSNISMMSKGYSMRTRTNASFKTKVNRYINETLNMIGDNKCRFLNKDFRDVFNTIAFEYGKNKQRDLSKVFVYDDPPYLETENNYATPKWTKDDFCDVLDTNIDQKVKFAVSEFSHPFVIEQAEKRNLNIIRLKERQTIKNKNIEILITNYDAPYELFPI